MKNVDMKFRLGEEIYGDNFLYEEIEEWYHDEENGYADMVPESHKETFDEYKGETNAYLYHYLKENFYPHILSYGGGYGTEILPIIDRIGDVVILDPGRKFHRSDLQGKKISYKVPSVSGEMDFDDETFDLITCFGVLHHIPNVSFILTEMSRVVKKGGTVLIREPITSMNVFDLEVRPGSTKRERGLPLDTFCRSIERAGFLIELKRVYKFGPFMKLPFSPFFVNTAMGRAIDRFFSNLFMFNYKYDARNFVGKLRPTTVALVLKKPQNE